MNDDQKVRAALTSLEATAASAATWTSLDSAGRTRYNKLAKRYSDEIWARYKAGTLSADNAARLAQESRNEIMLITRARSSPYGRERAKALKARGKTLEELMDKYSREKFRRGFYELKPEEQGTVYEDIIRAAGRPNARFNAEARTLGRLGKGLWVVTVVVIVWDVATSKNKVETAMRDITDLAAGVLGSMAAGALVGLAFGPVGAIIGGLVGGILGSLLADKVIDWFEAHSPTPEQTNAMLHAVP